MGTPQPGTPVQSGGGAQGDPLTGYRDLLDARRSATAPFTPNAEYPDGYLGQVNSRREDRLLEAVSSRLTARNYQRGVHKGEKLSTQDYFWPPEFGPDSALKAQVGGKRWGPVGSLPVEQINHMGKNHMLTPSQMSQVASQHNVKEITPVDPIRQQRMSALLPRWSA